jgi:hypothetical protein
LPSTGNVRVSRDGFRAHAQRNLGQHGAWWIGDYQGLASAAGAVHPFWNDSRTGRLEILAERMPKRVPTSQGTTSP